MTAIQAAQERLEQYVRSLADKPLTYEQLLRLRSMEAEIVLTTRLYHEREAF